MAHFRAEAPGVANTHSASAAPRFPPTSLRFESSNDGIGTLSTSIAYRAKATESAIKME